MKLTTYLHLLPIIRMGATVLPRSICLYDMYRDSFTLQEFVSESDLSQ